MNIYGNNPDTSGNENYMDDAFDFKINIFPNPTKGVLKINIEGSIQNQNLMIEVYNIQGALILEQKANANFNVVDLSKHPKGTYLLVFSLGETSSKWKIIKE